MVARTSAGTVIAVSAGVPATFDNTGFAALTYTPIGEVTDLGEFGREYALVTHNPLATRSTVKKKGSYNSGSITVAMALDTDDAGQVIMRTASTSDADFAFRVTLQNGDVYYFRGQVMSFRIGVGSVDAITTASATVELTASAGGVDIIEAPAA